MMNVNGVHAVNASGAVEPPAKTIQVPQAAPLERGQDVVEISTAAKLAAKVQNLPAVRTELVNRVKAEIAAGVYETPERLEIAIDRLMEDLYPNL